MASPPVLRYPSNVPPVAVLAAARIGGVDLIVTPEKEWLNASPPTLTLEGGAKLSGVASLLRYVARLAPASAGLYGADILSSTLVRSLSPPLRTSASPRAVDVPIELQYFFYLLVSFTSIFAIATYGVCPPSPFTVLKIHRLHVLSRRWIIGSTSPRRW